MVRQPLRAPIYVLDAGVVASEHPLASLIGVRVLEAGGNAVDAAVAVSFALAVLQPHLGGIGGDFFALVRTVDGRVRFVNGSCGAPSKLTIDFLEKRGLSRIPERGPLSINPPGMVDGLHLLWRIGGSMEWRRLVEPAMMLARKGFPASHGLAAAIEANRRLLERDDGSRATYLSISGPGHHVRFNGLASLLELVASDPRAFYEGEVARAIEEYVTSRGGLVLANDLKACRAVEDKPLSVEYDGCRVYEMPPNTQGVSTLHGLLLAEELGLASIEPGSRRWVEAMLRIFNAVYWARDSLLGDPRYMPIPVEELLSDSVLEELRRRLELPRLGAAVSGGGDTTYFAVADREGNVVSAIQSLFHHFGSGLTEPRFQVTLNSRASGFIVARGHPNSPAPGKRPLHTLSAVIAECTERVTAIGLSGGHYRPQLHLQLLVRILGRGEEVGEVIEAPRFIWEPWTDRLVAEQGVNAFVPGFRVEVRRYPSRLGVAAAVVVEGNGVRRAYTDVRGDGLAAAELQSSL